MKELIKASTTLIDTVETTFSRLDILKADWNERLIAVQGHRGVGKTTLLLQYLASQRTKVQCIYLSMDHFYFQSNSLFETIQKLNELGYTLFVIDEVHKYANWSIEIKNVYDTFKKLKVIISGSSALEIYKSNADLSRRAVSFTLPVLSLREFISIETGKKLETYSLENILNDHTAIALALNKKIGSPLKYFKQYLQNGCYPFYLEGVPHYSQKLMRTTTLVLETDIAAVTNVNFQSITKMKKLLAFIAQSVPFKPNITRLAEVIETKRDTTMLYLEYLQRASVIRMLNVSGQTMGRLSKPEKIYLDNTNLAFALCLETPNIGNLRETFLLSQLTAQCKVEASPVSDFLVNGKFTFECGSKNKQNKQVKEVKNSFIIKDDLLTGSKNEIPLWLFGFLY